MILAVIPSPVAGGAERQTMQVARGLGASVTADAALGFGAAARQRVLDEYLGTRSLTQYMSLLQGLLDQG